MVDDIDLSNKRDAYKRYYQNNREKRRLLAKKLYNQNKLKNNERTKKWFKENPEKIKEYNDSRKEYSKVWRENNKPKIKEISDKYYKDNAISILKRNSILHQNKRAEIIYHYSNGKMKCNSCGEDIYEFLEIDHLNGGGHQHYTKTHGKVMNDIIKNNFPEEYQILCSNCNIKKLKEVYKLKGDKWKFQKSYNQRLKIKALKHYSSEVKCDCCNEGDIDVLTIDHINGGGRKHRKEVNGSIYKWLIDNNFPEEYRVLCHNCNQSYGHRGYCPHQIK